MTPTGNPVGFAQSKLGCRYVWDTPLNFASADPTTFDCSGLVGWSYYQAGRRPMLPHSAQVQYTLLEHRPLAEAQTGDTIYYGPRGSKIGIYHTALVVSPGVLIEAPDATIPVRIRNYTASDDDIVQTVGIWPGGATSVEGATTGDTPLIDLIHQAGFMHKKVPGTNLYADELVYALAGGESSFNPSAHNDNLSTGDNSYGLLQINMLGSLDKPRLAEFGISSDSALLDPSTNLAAAYKLTSGGTDFGAWGLGQNAYRDNSQGQIDGWNKYYGGAMTAVVSGGDALAGAPTPASFGKPPYTQTERAAVYAAILKYGGITFNSGASDKQVLAEYTRIYSQAGFQSAGGLQGTLNTIGNLGEGAVSDAESVGDVLSSLSGVISWLTSASNWKRIGLFALGAIILLVVAIELFKG